MSHFKEEEKRVGERISGTAVERPAGANDLKCNPLQYKRGVIEGTVPRVFSNTSTWENFDTAMRINRKLYNQ